MALVDGPGPNDAESKDKGPYNTHVLQWAHREIVEIEKIS